MASEQARDKADDLHPETELDEIDCPINVGLLQVAIKYNESNPALNDAERANLWATWNYLYEKYVTQAFGGISGS